MGGASEFNFPFPATRWTLVVRAGVLADQHARGALQELMQAYLGPMKAHLLSRGISADAADDLLQDFVVDKLLERNIVSLADPIRGKFRSFLLTTLDRFVIDAQRRGNAAKRNPGGTVNLHAFADVLPDPILSPPRAFDVAWAKQVLNETATRMRSDCSQTHRPQLWGLFEERVLKPALDGSRARGMPELAEQFQIDSAASASNQLSTAKRMFARIFRSVIREYTADETELQEEVRELWEIVSSARQNPFGVA